MHPAGYGHDSVWKDICRDVSSTFPTGMLRAVLVTDRKVRPCQHLKCLPYLASEAVLLESPIHPSWKILLEDGCV